MNHSSTSDAPRPGRPAHATCRLVHHLDSRRLRPSASAFPRGAGPLGGSDLGARALGARAISLLALSSLLVAGAPSARAAQGARVHPPTDAAQCKIVIILGQTKRAPLPASLTRFRRDLAGGPFRRFGAFSLLGKRQTTLRSARRSRRDLIGPYRFEGRLLGRSAPRKGVSQIRFEAYLYRHRPGRKDRRLLRTRLLATPGTTVLLAGPRFQGGRLIFALTCR